MILLSFLLCMAYFIHEKIYINNIKEIKIKYPIIQMQPQYWKIIVIKLSGHN